MSSLTSWTDLERQIQNELDSKKERENQTISCPKCGGTWFFEMELCQYREDHTVIIGQRVPKKLSAPECQFLICGRCLSAAGVPFLEPRIETSTREISGGKQYDFCIDTLEGKHDKRKDVPGQGIVPGAITTEKI